MRCPAWSAPIGACLLVAAIAGCKSSRPASAATTADAAAFRECCTSDELGALRQTWKLRRQQLQANTDADDGRERDVWEEGMLGRCKAATPPGRCIADAYQQQLRELDALVYARYLNQKFTGAQVLSALYAGFDPRTAKTGRKTELNAKSDGGLGDELVVFFRIAEPPFLPGHLLVLDVVSNGFEGYKAKGFFSVVKAEGSRLVVVGREPLGDPSNPLLVWYDTRAGTKLKFDLANYKINDRERAFGYRLATWDGGTGASYGSESLLLFRLTPEGMRRVLDVDMESDDAAWDNQEGKVYKDKKQRLVLIVGSNQHEGNYDWILKGRLIDKRIKRSRALKGVTYVWKNGEYVPAAD